MKDERGYVRGVGKVDWLEIGVYLAVLALTVLAGALAWWLG